MNFTVLPAPTPQSIDTSNLATKSAVESADKTLQDLIDLLNAGEVADDATATSQANAIASLASAIALKADKTAVDTAIAAVPVSPSPMADNQPIYEPATPPPSTMGSFGTSNATLVSQAGGSYPCNMGRYHQAKATTGTDIANTWQLDFSIPFRLRNGPLSLRWGFPTLASGSARLTIDGVVHNLTKSAGVWSSVSSEITAFVDGRWSWFAIQIPAGSTNVACRINLPAGDVLLPTLYSGDAVTAIAVTYKGIKVFDPRSGKSTEIREPRSWIQINVADVDEWFFKPVPGGGALTRLQFEVTVPAKGVVHRLDIDNFVEGYSGGGYFTNAKTLNGVPIAGPQPYQNGKERRYQIDGCDVVVATYPEGNFLIAAQLTAPPYTLGRIRNVCANGVFVD